MCFCCRCNGASTQARRRGAVLLIFKGASRKNNEAERKCRLCIFRATEEEDAERRRKDGAARGAGARDEGAGGGGYLPVRHDPRRGPRRGPSLQGQSTKSRENKIRDSKRKGLNAVGPGKGRGSWPCLVRKLVSVTPRRGPNMATKLILGKKA